MDSAPSATASLVSALGGGSGIDMTALASNLAAAQFAARTDRLTARSETLEAQISSASSLKSMLLSLSTSLGERVRTGDLSPQPLVSNPAVARATLSGGVRPSGSYSLEVTTLAASQTLVAPALTAATAPAGAGSLTLRFGTVTGAAFSEDTGRPAITIAIPSGATLADVANAITASGAGVSAYVANTVDGARLVLKGQEGAASGFILEAAETPGEEGLARLAWEPATGDPARLAAAAEDAAFRIDGLSMTSRSNSVTDAVPGLNLVLSATNPGAPARIGFADPATAITSVMQDLVSALNEIAAELATATSPRSGDLARDGGALALKRTLSQLAGAIVLPNALAGAPQSLSDLGLVTQRDGSFSLDGKRLAATLKADPQGAAGMFTTGLYGVFATIDGLVRRSNSAGDPGSLAGSIGRYTAQQSRITQDLAKLTEQQATLRTRLIQRFATTDRAIGVSRSTLSFLQNQIAAWNPREA